MSLLGLSDIRPDWEWPLSALRGSGRRVVVLWWSRELLVLVPLGRWLAWLSLFVSELLGRRRMSIWRRGIWTHWWTRSCDILRHLLASRWWNIVCHGRT